ncbi:MAG: GYF domain-containing protein, partial [Myxococcota bacterium]
MKFSCDKCETKYSIADEKVRGKVLKIRCKKCENIIVLREPAPTPAAAAEPAQEEQPTRAVALDPATLAQLRSAAPSQAKEPARAAAPQRAATGAVLPKAAPTGQNDSTRVVSYSEMENVLKRGDAQPAAARTASSAAAAPARVTSPQPAASRAPAAPPAPEPSPEWYLAIGGQQVGPLTTTQVEGKISAREADERTYGWCEGMGDWKRLADIP